MNGLRIISAYELKEVLRKHSLWLAEEGGKQADLRGANLSSADLSEANLRGADLRDANLSGADLSGANLSGADLSEADLSGANLIRADLRGANLRGANLRDANLSGANLSGADLSGANLSGANLRDADLSGANLIRADLRGANLRGANLSGANLILIGQDIRGYLFWAYKNDDGVVVIRAGCRTFTGIGAAYAHWTERHTNDAVLHADCLSLVARCETMAKARGWKLEAE